MELSQISPDMIPSLTVMSAQEKVVNKASTLMLAKTLDVSEQGGEALINMMRETMELSVNPGVGAQFDERV